MGAFGFVVNATGVFVFVVFNLNRGAFGRDNTTRVFVSVTATTHQGWFCFGGNEPPPPRGARVVVVAEIVADSVVIYLDYLIVVFDQGEFIAVAADKGKAPMPDLDIPAEYIAEDAQARKRFEDEQASERLVHQLQAEGLAQEYMPNVSEERAKELDDLMMRMTETDWLNLMMQVGSTPALAKELLGADVSEENFIERMTAVKERKKRALADLRYRALKGKPLKKSEVTQLMRNLVKNQWCAAHNGTITMKEVKALNHKQLVEEYEYICRRLEKDRLLSAQYNLF
ncbi:hypothetical protein Tco_0570954 [Tanacetum coccineum]